MTQLSNPDKLGNLNHDIEGLVTNSQRVTWSAFTILALFLIKTVNRVLMEPCWHWNRKLSRATWELWDSWSRALLRVVNKYSLSKHMCAMSITSSSSTSVLQFNQNQISHINQQGSRKVLLAWLPWQEMKQRFYRFATMQMDWICKWIGIQGHRAPVRGSFGSLVSTWCFFS